MNYFQKTGFSYDCARNASVTSTDRSKPALPRRIPGDNTTKTGVSAATIGRVIAAVRGQQTIRVVIVPRRTTQHAESVLRIVPILTPLPHVASHIVQPILVCREAANR